MAHGATVASAVMFVRDLDRSVSFYTELLALRVVDRSPTAALLASEAGVHLILRAMGSAAVHALGAAGVQYVVWTVPSERELTHCERVLHARSAHAGRRSERHISVVEGRDPDGFTVVVCHPGPDEIPPDELRLSSRIYAW
jgi:catechol 2,3-dioxygenase-like lactoylglutathione lyase family enzyme